MIDFEEQPIGRGDHRVVRGFDATRPASSGEYRHIDSRPGFQEALREAFSQAAGAGCRELWLCDLNYANWPLGEVKVVEMLTAWAYAHRKLVLLGLDFDEVPRRHPRFMAWRRHWSHVVESRMLCDIESTQVPCVLWAQDLVCVKMADPVHFRGQMSMLQSDLSECRELLDAVTQRSVEAFPVTTLGL